MGASNVVGKLSATPARLVPSSLSSPFSAAFPAPSSGSSTSQVTRRKEFWMGWARGGAPNSLVHTVPAASRRTVITPDARHDKDFELDRPHQKIQQVVAVKTQQLAEQIKSKLPPITAPPKDDTGFYYGLTNNMVHSSTTNREKKARPPRMREAIVLTLDEVRELREEMEALRKEVQSLKVQLSPSDSLSTTPSPKRGSVEAEYMLSKEQLEQFYQEMGNSVEAWAAQLMEEGVEDGWVEVKCNKVMRKSINPNGTTRAYMKWLKDTRGVGLTNPKDNKEYPCLKFSGVIDAPLDVVSLYLSQEENVPEYNDLIESHKDLQEITPSSKVCFGQTPQILFIRPRSLVTYCQHRWLADGSQLILSQACRHPKRLNKRNAHVFQDSDEYDDNKQPMAFAFRGLNHIGPEPSDPINKTRITMLAHGNPGTDVPTWAIKTAVGALANIEPFKLFHRIDVNVRRKLPELQAELDRKSAQLVTSYPDGRTKRPAGIAQLGYACFWPNGGGQMEKNQQSPLAKVLTLSSDPRPLPNNVGQDDDQDNSNDSSAEHSNSNPNDEELQQGKAETVASVSRVSSPVLDERYFPATFKKAT